MATTVDVRQETVGGTRSRVLATRYAWLVVLYNVVVIVWGAMVRATGSGAGCGNHWPLCNGQVIPVSPSVHTVIEFTHRLMTGGSTFLVIGLLVWTFRATTKGSAARVAAVVSGVLLVNEALLGALLVKLGYVTVDQSVGRMVMLSVHLTNTLLLLGGLTMTAVLLGTGQRRGDVVDAWGRSWIALVGLVATLVVGVSGSMAALGDTLYPSTSLRAAVEADLSAAAPMLIRLRWVHPASALVAAVFVVVLLARSWSSVEEPRARLARWIAWLLAMQFVLGTADVLLLAPVWLQLLHLLGADLVWVALVWLAAISVMPRRSEAASGMGAQIWHGKAGAIPVSEALR